MEHVLVNGVPLPETLAAIDESDFPETERRQKFVQVFGNQELHITACAVSKMAGVDQLPELDEYEHYFVEPNQKWLENQSDPFAWVKVYYKLNPKTDFITMGQVQAIRIPMPFLGESYKECWGEIQLNIKKKIVRNGNTINLKDAKIGRNMCFDTRVGKWVPEIKPIIPKKDAGTHGYVALRLYHRNYLPTDQPDWHFEPIYAVVGGKNFYRIDAIWQKEEVTITATQLDLDSDSSEIPKFLR